MPPRRPKSEAEDRALEIKRFEAKIIPEPNSGCWLWIGCVNPQGYGLFHSNYFKYGYARAHVYSYELYKGPRNGLDVLHDCDVTCCVNPEHLHLGTDFDNAREREARKRRNVKGIRNGRAKLTENDVRAIRLDSRRTTDIARTYGVGFTAIAEIKSGKRWSHLE